MFRIVNRQVAASIFSSGCFRIAFRLPGPSQAYSAVFSIRGIHRQGTSGKYKTDIAFFGVGRGKVACISAGKSGHVKFTVQEIGFRIAKYKIYCSFNITVLHLYSGACPMEIQGVLTAKKLTIFQINLVRRGSEGRGRRLLPLPGMIRNIIAVLKGNAGSAEACGIGRQQHRTALVGSHIIFILRNKFPLRVKCIRRIITLLNYNLSAIAVHGLERYPRLIHRNFFSISPRRDQKYQRF